MGTGKCALHPKEADNRAGAACGCLFFKSGSFIAAVAEGGELEELSAVRLPEPFQPPVAFTFKLSPVAWVLEEVKGKTGILMCFSM